MLKIVLTIGVLFTVTESAYPQSPLLPKKLAIYYGQPSKVNGSGGNLDAAAEVFNDYDTVVLGDGLQFPQASTALGDPPAPGETPYYGCDQNRHFGHNNTVEIIRRLKTSPNNTEVYGYVSIGGENTARRCSGDLNTPVPLTPEEIRSRIDDWNNMGVSGIFLDEAEYGFGCSRERQNEAVDYVHSKGLKAFINAWDPDDVFQRSGGGQGVLLPRIYPRIFHHDEPTTSFRWARRLADPSGSQ